MAARVRARRDEAGMLAAIGARATGRSTFCGGGTAFESATMEPAACHTMTSPSSPAAGARAAIPPSQRTKSPTLSTRLVFTRCLWVCLTLYLCLTLGPALLRIVRPVRERPTDFFQDWASARNLVNGLPIYTSQHITWRMYAGESVDAGVPVWAEINAHPPTSVLLALPLVWLDYPDAGAFAWNLISLAALAGSLWLVLRQTGLPFSPWSLAPLMTFLLLCVPLRVHLYFGQLGARATAADQRARGQRGPIGKTGAGRHATGGCHGNKTVPRFLFLYLVLRRRWPAVRAGALSLMAFTMLTAAVLGWGTYRSYVLEVMPKISWFRAGWNNASIPGFWSKLFDPAPDVPRSLWQTVPAWQNATLARCGALLSCAAVIAVVSFVILRARSRAECDRAYGCSYPRHAAGVADYLGALFRDAPGTDRAGVGRLSPGSAGGGSCLFLLVQVLLFFVPPAEFHELVIDGGSTRGVATPVLALTVSFIPVLRTVGA